jgi:hypothetical protein
MDLASAVILGSESRGTRDHISLSQIRDSPNLEGQVPVFISPRHWVPFSSPATTRRATVELFKVTLQLTVSPGVEPPLGLMTRYLLVFDSYGLVFVGRPL